MYDGEFYKFYNGLAQVAGGLCTTQGEIIIAEDLGGSSFVMSGVAQKAFKDGYILVQKTTTTFQGSKSELAIFNSDLEKIVDYSAELYEIYVNNCDYGGTQYYNGYIYGVIDGYLDLRTGILYDDVTEMYETMELKHKSDFWCEGGSSNFGECYVIDWRTDEIIFDFCQYAETMNIVDYKDGFAGVYFEVEDASVGERYYFTIMNEEGEFLFDPIETPGAISSYSIKSENGIFVLYIDGTYPNDNDYIQVYNASGKIAEKEFKASEGLLNLDFGISDNIIYIDFWDYSYEENCWKGFYNTLLQPIF